MMQAYKKWNLCDHFCFMLYAALRKCLKSQSVCSDVVLSIKSDPDFRM